MSDTTIIAGMVTGCVAILGVAFAAARHRRDTRDEAKGDLREVTDVDRALREKLHELELQQATDRAKQAADRAACDAASAALASDISRFVESTSARFEALENDSSARALVRAIEAQDAVLRDLVDALHAPHVSGQHHLPAPLGRVATGPHRPIGGTGNEGAE